jgi:hypothetical protein
MQEDNFARASAFCGQQGMEPLTVDQQENDAGFPTGVRAEMQFRCVPSEDPELTQPQMPNAIRPEVP